MEKHLFYVPDITHPETVMPADESRHCIKVLRLKAGDELYITNGTGKLYRCTLLDEDYKKALVKIEGEFESKPPRAYRLHIAIAPTKNISRLEWFLEKCTEIGIDEITPLLCENSERQVIKPQRLNKIIIAAAKQSLTASFPVINKTSKFKEFIEGEHQGEKYIAYLDKKSSSLKAKYTPGKNVVILVGPEGDFTGSEAQEAVARGFAPVNLGEGRLRTETAGVVACTTIALLNEE
jgi:16S rRNA (uracil1498-N3)-methyltransferase